MDERLKKVLCENRRCGWRGLDSALLRAPHPFAEGVEMVACPSCKDTESLRSVCDEPWCCKEAVCGTPTPNGYRVTCGEHVPPREAA